MDDYGKVDAAEQRHNAEMEAIKKRHETQQALADQQHSAALRQQAQQRADSKREAYIAHERLQKYLPQAQAAAGTGGMGMSETAKVQGLNAYLGQRSMADAAYASGVAELEAAKKVADTERALSRQEAERISLQDYLDTKQVSAEEMSDAVGSIVGSKMENYRGTDGKISLEDYRRLEDYVSEHRDQLTAGDAALLDLTLQEYREQIRTEAEQMAVDKDKFTVKGVTLSGKNTLWQGISDFDDGNNFTVMDAAGNEYKVELDAKNGAVIDPEVLAAAKQTEAGEIFGIGNKLYLNNGTDVYGIRSQGGNDQKDWDALYKLFFENGEGRANGQYHKTLQKLGLAE